MVLAGNSRSGYGGVDRAWGAGTVGMGAQMKEEAIVDVECSTGPIKMYETWAPGRKCGHLHMTLADTEAKIMEGDKQVGTVVGCIGGATEVRIDGYHYTLRPLDLWQAVLEMHTKRLAEEKR